MAFKVRVSGQERPLGRFSAAGVLVATLGGALDGKALVLELEGALLAVVEVLALDIDVEAALGVLVVLARPGELAIDAPALGPASRVLVGEGVRGVLPGGEGLAGHATGGGAVDVVDVELVFLVLLGVLTDETAPLGSGLHVVSLQQVVELGQRPVQLDLHLTNITDRTDRQGNKLQKLGVLSPIISL